MDLLAVTDFPDIRFKSLIQSAKDGSIIIIPREGGYLFRLYIEMDKLDVGERVSDRNITSDDLIAAARRILNPYTLDVKEVPWWSVYEIGQRLCDKFDDAPNRIPGACPAVFIAGDACHTHSPKAGQGMNVSMQDGFNLGWKLASVLRKRLRARPAPDLFGGTSGHRQGTDRLRSRVGPGAQFGLEIHGGWRRKGFDPAETQSYFVRHGRYTAGTAAHYRPSILTGAATPSAYGRRSDHRYAFSFRTGRSRRRRQAGSAWPHHQGRRPLAHLCLCESGRSCGAQLRHPGPVRLSGRSAEVAGEEDTPQRARTSTR